MRELAMKFRLIIDNNEKEITVLTENGGIACIRQADDISPDEPRMALTEYYGSRLVDIPTNREGDIFEWLSEGSIYFKDWTVEKYNSLTAIQDALSWLVVGQVDWELSDSIFTQYF